MSSWQTLLFLIGSILIVFASSTASAATLTCSIINSSENCRQTAVFSLQNDTGGFTNAHVQNATNVTAKYNFTLCCDSDVSVFDRCSDGTAFLHLSNVTSAHAQMPNYTQTFTNATNYTVKACLSAHPSSVDCTVERNTSALCSSSDRTCLISMASSEPPDANQTNAHVGPCSQYETKVCCKVISFEQPAASSGGGGGGGSGGTATTPLVISPEEAGAPFVVQPQDFSISLIAGEKETRTFTLTNRRNASMVVSAEVVALQGILVLQEVITLKPYESKPITLEIGPVERGLFAGKIVFRARDALFGTEYVEEGEVIITTRSKDFLFDTSLTIPEQYQSVRSGEKVRAQVTLSPKGPAEGEQIRAIVGYVIKDFRGETYFEEEENVSLEGSANYVKEFPTLRLPPGKYLLGMELSYAGAFSTTSATFTILEGRSQWKAFLLQPVVLTLLVLAGAWFVFIGARVLLRTLFFTPHLPPSHAAGR